MAMVKQSAAHGCLMIDVDDQLGKESSHEEGRLPTDPTGIVHLADRLVDLEQAYERVF